MNPSRDPEGELASSSAAVELPPAISELIERYPVLEQATLELLSAASVVRSLRLLVFPENDLPRARRGERYRQALERARAALDRLEVTSSKPTLEPSEIEEAARDVLVAIAGCLNGIRCGRSASAVGQATTSAVVMSIVAIVVADAILTLIHNLLGI